MSMRYEHYDSEEPYDDLRETEAAQDREISLGTATVLGIFLALALVCALFFGFGYSMGRRSVPSALANVNTGISAPLPDSRPTPGTLATPRSSYVLPTESAGEAAGATDEASGSKAPAGQKGKPAAATAATDPDATPGTPQSVQHQQVARAIAQAIEQKPLPSKAPLAVDGTAAAPSVGAAGASYVQVAAISVTHKEDAEMLRGSLQRRGYAVAIHQGTQDQLLHVQIGPLASKKEAEDMKKRLITDGYNAIVK